MKEILSLNLLFGVLLAGSSVVADDASQIATGNKMIAHPRHASAIPLEASATDAMSATTSNFQSRDQQTAPNQVKVAQVSPPANRFAWFGTYPEAARSRWQADQILLGLTLARVLPTRHLKTTLRENQVIHKVIRS